MKSEASPGRTEDQRRGQHRAKNQHAAGDQREHRSEALKQKAERRLRRDDDHARDLAGDDHRRRAQESEAARIALEAVAAASEPADPLA